MPATKSVPEPAVAPRPAETIRNSGPLSMFPSSWRPYLELTRFHKPAGLMGFYLPYVIGLFFAANIARQSKMSGPDIARLSGIFLLDSLLLRSSGCAWNDNVDQDFDRKVTRCRNRPIARGAVSSTGATVLTFSLVVVRLSVLWISLPRQCIVHALATSFLAIIYPFMKRISHYPQLCLGFAVGWAIFLVCAAVDGVGDPFRGPNSGAILALFAAQTLWNITYDTVYAFQDLRDDVKAGVKSMAVKFQASAKPLLSSFVAANVVFLFASGLLAGLGIPFFAGAMGAAAGLVHMLIKVDLDEPSSCRWFFVSGQWIVSGSIVVGLVAEYVEQVHFHIF